MLTKFILDLESRFIYPCFRRVPNKWEELTLELTTAYYLRVLKHSAIPHQRPQITAKMEVNFPGEAGIVPVEATSDDIGR